MSAKIMGGIRRVWRLLAPAGLRQSLHVRLGAYREARAAAERRRALQIKAYPCATRPGGAQPIRIVGYFGATHGIGASARLATRAFESLGVPVEILDVSGDAMPRLAEPHEAAAWVFHLNPPELHHALERLGPENVVGPRYGYWAWELPAAPREWLRAGRMVHEIWAPSAYAARAFSGARAPVRVVPHPLILRDYATAPSKQAGEDFLAVSLFDFNSSAARKNPMGAVTAFRMAFDGDPRARLIIKTQGGKQHPAHLALLQAAASPNIEVVDGRWPYAEVKALIAGADVLISLHRAEGFGLTLAEAMALRTPVLATAFSGNLDFMDADNSLLIRSRPIPVIDPQGIYRGQTWAEPDLAAAAEALIRLRRDPSLGPRLAEAARLRIETRLSAENWLASLPPAVQSAAMGLKARASGASSAGWRLYDPP